MSRTFNIDDELLYRVRDNLTDDNVRLSEKTLYDYQTQLIEAMNVNMIMILLYGAGGEPGRGEIPMRWFRKPSLSDFPIRGCLGQILKNKHYSQFDWLFT